MYYETVFSNYKDMGGIKIPGRFHQHQDYDDGARLPNISGGDHAFGLETITDVKVNVANAVLMVPDAVRQAAVPAVRVETTKLADGVWLLGGGSHNSVLIEFRDNVAVIEAPLNEERSLAVIAEVAKLVPNKPIRYVVNTHMHFDHSSGLSPFAAEGITIITHENNKDFLEKALSGPRTLAGDNLAKANRKPSVETAGDRRVLRDATRTIELHHIKNLEHSDGMLVAYLPAEKLLLTADFNVPAQGQPLNPSIAVLRQNVERLKLDVVGHVLVHAPNPDRPVTNPDLLALAKGTN